MFVTLFFVIMNLRAVLGRDFLQIHKNAFLQIIFFIVFVDSKHSFFEVSQLIFEIRHFAAIGNIF